MTRSAGVTVSWQKKLLEDAQKKKKKETDDWQMKLLQDAEKKEEKEGSASLLPQQQQGQQQQKQERQQQEFQQHVVPPSPVNPRNSGGTAAAAAAAARRTAAAAAVSALARGTASLAVAVAPSPSLPRQREQQNVEITWHRELAEESEKTKGGLLRRGPQNSTPRDGSVGSGNEACPKNGTSKKDEPQNGAAAAHMAGCPAVSRYNNLRDQCTDANTLEATDGKSVKNRDVARKAPVASADAAEKPPPNAPHTSGTQKKSGGDGKLKKEEDPITRGCNIKDKKRHETNKECEVRRAAREPEVEVISISDEEPEASPLTTPTMPKAPPPPPPTPIARPEQRLSPTAAPTTPKAPPPPPPPSPPPSTTPTPKAPPPTKSAPPSPPSAQAISLPPNTLLAPEKEQEVPLPCSGPTPSASPLTSILTPHPKAGVRRPPSNPAFGIPKRAVLIPRAQVIIAQRHESAADILARRCAREVTENEERVEDDRQEQSLTKALRGPEKDEEVTLQSASPLPSVMKPLPDTAFRRPLRPRAEATPAQKGESAAQILARWESEEEGAGEGEEGDERAGAGTENENDSTQKFGGHGEIGEAIYIRSDSESLSREEQTRPILVSFHHSPEGERKRGESLSRGRRQSSSRHDTRNRGRDDVELCGRDTGNSRSCGNASSCPVRRTVRSFPASLRSSKRSSNGLFEKQGNNVDHIVETINSKGATPREVDEHACGVRSPKTRRRLEFRSNSVETIHSKSSSEADEHGEARSPKRRRFDFRSGVPPRGLDRPLSDYVSDMKRGLF